MVQWVYRQTLGVALPRTAQDQFAVGTVVPPGGIQAGDIVFFANTNGPGITHNGIALGDGRFVHAKSEGPARSSAACRRPTGPNTSRAPAARSPRPIPRRARPRPAETTAA